MSESPGRRRSTRRRSSPVRNAAQDTRSSSVASDDSESDAQDDTFKAPANTKRTKTKASAKRGTKKTTKRQKTVLDAVDDASENNENRVENFLYEAITDPETSIDTLINDFLDSYNENQTESIKDLVNMVIRCCGAKTEITSYDVEDVDTIPETLTQLQDHLTGKDADVVKVTLDTYPLVSRNKVYKGFRRQLCEFWNILAVHAADKQILYEDEPGKLFPTIEAWLVSMSSSTLRAFRHTSTAVCLAIMTSMVELSAKHLKDIEVANKQLTAEEKKQKKAASKIKAIQKTIDTKTNENEKLTEMISNYFDAVFVHRYRDIDAKIRSESIRELGIWMMTLPSTFFEGQYLRYLGWVLSDTQGSTRMEVIKALTKLYGYDEYAGGLRHFTERFKPRMMEIALEDVETPIRCAAITLIERVRQRGYLEDEDTERIIGCIFDSDEKVRAAVSGTLNSVLEDRENELIDEQLGGDVEDHGSLKSSWTNLKAIVSTLAALSNIQDELNKEEEQQINLVRETAGLCPGRVRIAALSFLHDLKEVEFNEIAAYLLFDNDASADPASVAPGDLLKSVLCLTSVEEQILLELLVASAELANVEAEKKQNKGEDSSIVAESVIDILPQLLVRFTDAHSLSTSLQLLTVCDLSIYSRLRKTAQFETLLDSIIKLFFGYQEYELLRDVGCILVVLSKEATLSTLVKDRVLDLQDLIRSNFLEASTEEEDLASTLKRLHVISSADDCVLSFDDTSGATTSAYSKLKELLPSKSELVRTYTRGCLRNYFMWKVKQLTETRFGLDMKEVENLILQRDDVLYVLDSQLEDGDESAMTTVVELENIFTHLNVIEAYDGLSTRRAFDVNLQKLLVRLFQKAVKQYGKLHNRNVVLEGDISSDDDHEGESETEESDSLTRKIESERRVCVLAGEMVVSFCAEKLDNKYVNLLYDNKGKLGHSFDAILKELDKQPGLTKPGERPIAKAKSVSKGARTAHNHEDVLMSEVQDDIEGQET